MRTLRADEIECRVAHSTSSGASLLLYKDARVDMRLLDETYGPMNWQRHHEVVNGNVYCTIQIWDKEKGCWIGKQDAGKESFSEGEKGEASDSFKRAGFNWGIGRELYTAPFIWVNLDKEEFDSKGRVKTKFFCREIDYNEKNEIDYLVITDNKGNARYTFGKKVKPEASLAEAIAEMRSAESRQAVIDCWNKYPQYAKNESFRNACTEQGKKYQQ